MKRLIALILLVTFALGGCASVSLTQVQQMGDVELPVPEEDIPEAPSGDSSAATASRVPLYYISSDQQQLVALTRVVKPDADESLAEKAVKRLLEYGAEPSVRSIAPEGTRLNWLERSGEIVTLDLSVDALLLEPQEMCWMNAAITNTLTSIEGIKYVNILIGGKAENAIVLPSGTFSRTNLTLTALRAQQEADDVRFDADPESAQIERDVTLYFGGWQDNRLLPEVRRVVIDTYEIADVLIEALRQGPRNGSARPVLPSGAQLVYDQDSEMLEDDGRRILGLSFTGGLFEQLRRENLSAWQLFGSLTLTLCRSIPELDGLVISVGGQTVTEFTEGAATYSVPGGIMTPDMFDELIGRVAKLYFADADGGLCVAERLLDRQGAVSPRVLLEQLILGPYVFDGNANAQPVIPEGVTGPDILGIRVEDNTALINLSSNFYRVCQGLSATEERNLVYAIVNTLCELENVERVRFYIAGEVVDTLGGTIHIAGALLPNPGATVAR